MSCLIFNNNSFGIWTILPKVFVPNYRGEIVMTDAKKCFELKSVADVIVISLTQAEITNEVYIDALLESLVALIRSKPKIKLVLNLEKVEFMFSYMLGKISILFTETRIVEGEMKLCKIRGTVYEMMRIAKVNMIFEIYESEEEAITSF